MPRLLSAVFVAVTCSLVVLAGCGGDDDASSSPSATTGNNGPSTGTPAGTGVAGTVTPGKETPPAGGGDATPDPNTGGDVPSPSPAAGQGTPAVRPADADEFLQTIQGLSVDVHPCAYNPVTALANCAGMGVYSIQPPMVGQDINCQLLEAHAEPLAIQCASVEPPQTMYYEVRG